MDDPISQAAADELTRLRQLCATQTETIASMTRQAADNGQRLMQYHRDMRAIRAIADEMLGFRYVGPAKDAAHG